MASHFFIIEDDPIVRIDLEGMIAVQYPSARVDSVASWTELGPALLNSGPESAVFVRGTLISRDERLEKMIRVATTRQTRIVIIGARDQTNIPAFFVEPPFTSDMMLAALAGHVQEDGEPPPAA